ncbi:MAG: hypothetical protein ACOC4Z_01990, partial [Patescibacteria group bacterium]
MDKFERKASSFFCGAYNRKFNTGYLLAKNQPPQSDSADVVLVSQTDPEKTMLLQIQSGDEEVPQKIKGRALTPVSRWTEDEKSIRKRIIYHIRKKNKKYYGDRKKLILILVGENLDNYNTTKNVCQNILNDGIITAVFKEVWYLYPPNG